MAPETPPLILFTYPESVVGRRMEWYLTLRKIPYHRCRVDAKMPRPVLDRLGVHYRRIPVLAIGRDIYCDSRCIIDHLERLYTAVPRLGADEKQDPYQKGIERILENWAFDGGLFMRTAQLIPKDASLALSQEWLNDRAELMGRKFDTESLSKTLPDALAHARLHLQIIEENFLADGRNFLSGEAPGMADVHVLWIFDWMMRPKERMGMRHAYPEILNESIYPRTIAWVERMEQTFQSIREQHGAPQDLTADETVKAVEASGFWQPEELEVDANDPSGLERGIETDLIALDSAPQTGLLRRDVGKLAGLTVSSVTVSTETKNGVEIRIHYQRNNVRVAKAGGGPRLTASEIPKL